MKTAEVQAMLKECQKLLADVKRESKEIKAMHKDILEVKELVKDNLKMATELDRKQQQEIKEKVIKMASKAAKKAAKKSIAKARIREAFQSIDSDD